MVTRCLLANMTHILTKIVSKMAPSKDLRSAQLFVCSLNTNCYIGLSKQQLTELACKFGLFVKHNGNIFDLMERIQISETFI